MDTSICKKLQNLKMIITMKKTLFIIVLCTLAFSASAQNTAFKVQSDGNIAIQTNNTAVSPISINTAGNSSYYMSCSTGGKSGISLSAQGDNSGEIRGGYFSVSGAGTAVGMSCYAGNSTTCVGVSGHSVMGGKTIGVVGSTNQGYTQIGAGVYGTVHGDMGSQLTTSGDVFAGFFYGNVKVTGNLVATTTMQGTFLGESSSESSPATRGLSLSTPSVISSLSGLNVTTFQKERPEMPRDMELIDDLDGDTLPKGKEPEPDIMDEQFYDKTHYALDADRLEETFPNLVYVRKDGSKAINYMEMIPLLVQSINELSAKIEILEGQTSEGTAKKTRSATNKQASSLHQNKLYQNTPNPFKEQTIIRFSLADDVQDAAICIFDMTGKTVKKMPISSGMESVSIGGYELGEGMFLYSLVVNGQEIDTKKMIISK